MVTVSITAAPGRDRLRRRCPRAARPNVGPMGRRLFVTGPYQTRACAIAPVAFFRGVILMLKDIRPPVVSAKHATDMEAEGASSSPLEVQTETAPGAGPAIA